MAREAGATGRAGARGGVTRTVRGTVEFLWEDGDGVLVTLDTEEPGDPHTFEVPRELGAALSEGDRVEIVYEPVEHEVVDPDSGPSETYRAAVREIRRV
jgi:hypothetical protein